MVDSERVLRLLAGVLSDVDGLARLASEPDLDGNPDLLAAVKYRFITALEGVARVAHHISVAEGWAPPETNADAVRALGSRGVVDGDLAASLAAALGFRNLLVHGYATVDDSRVVGYLDRLDDLRAFAAGVAAWLTGR